MPDWTPVNPHARASELNAILAANARPLLQLSGLSEEEVLGRNFGGAVRYFRQVHGWTQQALAEQAHLDQSRIDAIEAGKIAPTLDIAGKLAHAFQIRLTQLIVAGEAINHALS
jgi:XRE family transcriptional regulator, regulator of sulfur utilization